MEHVAAPIREFPAGTGASNAPSHTTETLAQRDVEIHMLKDLVIKKDFELEALRKELQFTRIQPDNQATRQGSLNQKTLPPPKPQQTTP